MVRSVLGPNNTVIGIYSRDVYVPLLLGLMVGLGHLHLCRPFVFRLRPWTFAINIATLFALGIGLVYFNTLIFNIGSLATVLFLMGGALFLVLSGVCLFLSPGELLSRLRDYGARLWFLVAALGLLFAYPYILSTVWPVLVYATGHAVYALLKISGLNVTRFDIDYTIGIHHPDLRVSIGMGCSGLEGIFFFLFGYFLYLTFLDKRESAVRTTSTAALGILYMFTLNIIRIVLFFGVAVMINQAGGSRSGKRFFVWAFHENIGWLIYLAGIVLFFWMIRPRPQKRAVG